MRFFRRNKDHDTNNKSVDGLVSKSKYRDSVRTEVSKTRSVHSKAVLSSHWLITKNKGRADEKIVCDKDNLIPTAAIDWMINRLYHSSTSIYAHNAHNIALSDDATTPLAANLTFPGEITDGGLARTPTGGLLAATRDHTPGEDNITISKEFTATEAHTDIHKAALFAGETATQPIHVIVFAEDDSADGDVDLAINDTLTVEVEVTVAEDTS